MTTKGGELQQKREPVVVVDCCVFCFDCDVEPELGNKLNLVICCAPVHLKP